MSLQRTATDGPSHVNTTAHMCRLHEHFNGLKRCHLPRSIVVAPPINDVTAACVALCRGDAGSSGMVSKQTLATRC